jgi:hypothetical protein
MTEKEKIPGKEQSDSVPMPEIENIQQQLQRILNHPEFLASKQQRAFLKFVVSETMQVERIPLRVIRWQPVYSEEKRTLIRQLIRWSALRPTSFGAL